MSEEREDSLSRLGARSKLSRGRLLPEEPCPIRTAFQRDRDRIIHCNAFRRLKHKTQVFIAPQDDHFVTRLTHTLEVSQIARTISRALNLNEDLTEAIALGHDLGHTPFGHIGEEVLSQLFSGGFRHNEQSLRVVDVLENDGKGLNLTFEVRDGILNHSKSTSGVLDDWPEVATVEGEVVRIADIVAYVNHDLDDALRAGVISESDVPQTVISEAGNSRSQRINTMVSDIIVRSWSVREGKERIRPSIVMSPEIIDATERLRRFLFERVYNLQSAQKEAGRARRALRSLYRHFAKSDTASGQAISTRADEREVVDYIAGMTDQFALRLATKLSRSRKMD